MANNLQFILDGDSSVPPTEWPKLELQLNWDQSDGLAASLSTSQFTFEGNAAHRVLERIRKGTNSGVGILEGMPFEITDCNSLTALKGCADTAAAEAVYRCDRVTLPVRDNRIVDYLNDRKDGFSFAYLASLPVGAPGKISPSDYRLIPYCISSIPDYNQLLSTGITLFLITKEIAEIIRKTADIIAELSVPPVTLVGAVKLILQAAYLVIIVVAIIKLVQTFIDCIIQPKKYKKGMYFRTLMQRGSAYLGLSFSSTILDNPNSPYYRAAVIPRKIVQPNTGLGFKRAADENTTATSYGYYDGTFGQLIAQLEDVFNAKAVVRGSTLYFERVDFWNNTSSFTLPNLDLDGINNGSYRFNASELVSNYFTIWDLDNQELNTYDDYEGTSCQMQCTPVIVNDQKNVLLQHLTERRLGFSLGKGKKKLTGPEKAMQAIISIMAFFTGFPLPASRIDWLLLSNDFTGQQKFVVLDSSDKIHPNNKVLTSATTLMNNYHSVSFPLQNQWMLYEGWEIPFCCDDYVALLNNNVIRTFDGRLGKMLNLRWQIGSDVAVIDFKVRPVGGRYTNNLNQQIITDLR